MENKHNTCIELIRDGVVINVVSTDDFIDEKNDHSYEINTSINNMPTFEAKSQNPLLNSMLLHCSKKDKIRIKVGESGKENALFEGSYFSKSISQSKDEPTLNLEIKFAHSCFKLGFYNFNNTVDFENTTFENFVMKLLDLAQIDSKIKIDNTLKNKVIYGSSTSTNLLRALKELCLALDAVITFNRDDSISIEKRETAIARFSQQEPIEITDDEMISSTFNDGI